MEKTLVSFRCWRETLIWKTADGLICVCVDGCFIEWKDRVDSGDFAFLLGLS